MKAKLFLVALFLRSSTSRKSFRFLNLTQAPFEDCFVENPEYVGDGWCDMDDGYNTAECGWDGGDCCVETCVDERNVCGSNFYDCRDPSVLEITQYCNAVTLMFRSWEPECLLRECEGHCSNDDQCANGLYCYKREFKTDPPPQGCYGVAFENANYCTATSQSPSKSTSAMPTDTIAPSDHPTVSASPTKTSAPSHVPTKKLSSAPSHVPTQTQHPTAILEKQTLFTFGEYGRRMFPEDVDRPEGMLSYSTPPNCTSDNNSKTIGCVKTFKSFLQVPDWSGKVIDKPNNYITNDIKLVPNVDEGNIGFVEWNGVELPGGSQNTLGLAVADFNNDGNMDIFVGNIGSYKLFMNKGDGSSFDVIEIPGEFLEDLTISASDLNNDGYIDIVMGSSQYAPNQVLINAGGGKIFNLVDLPGGFIATYGVAVGDFDVDGNVDIVVLDFDGQSQLLMNAGDGHFLNTSLPGDLYGAVAVGVEDINNDGLVDIIIACEYSEKYLLLNMGDGVFYETTPFTDANKDHWTLNVVIADFNNDGFVDVVFGNYENPNELFFNNGQGQFFELIVLPGGISQSWDMVAADINNDGRLDMIVCNERSQNQVLLNGGNGLFVEANLPGNSTTKTVALAVADMDNDGTLDVIYGTLDTTNQLYFNSMWGSFGATHQLISDNLQGHAFAAFNNDSLPDILAYGSTGLTVFTNRGGGHFDVLFSNNVLNVRTVAVGDFNNDRNVDIVVGIDGETNQLFFNDGHGLFLHVLELVESSAITRSIAVADLDKDGSLDIVMGNKLGLNEVLLNSGNGESFEIIYLPGESDTWTKAVDVGDFNDDGNVDILIGDSMSSNLLLLNQGDGRVYSMIELPGMQHDTYQFAVADLNNDGKLDIVVSDDGLVNKALINRGDGQTFDEYDLPGGSRETKSIAAADLNSDGYVDIVVGNLAESNQVLWGKGNNKFYAFDIPGEQATNAISLADINNDGMIDIISATPSGSFISYFLPCPGGGAQVHGKSWCFSCPDFMGKSITKCLECLPDYMQEEGNEHCGTVACPFGKRLFGENECSFCSNGTFYDTNLVRIEEDTSTWNIMRCKTCREGEYAMSDYKFRTVSQCFKCPPGKYQNETGSSECKSCEKGTFQTKFGQGACIPCKAGGYCNSVEAGNGGFIPCSPGTYNENIASHKSSSCLQCPVGTYSITTGASNKSECKECLPGFFANETGQRECKPCLQGSSQPEHGKTSCIPCKMGTYSNSKGLSKCFDCPYRLSSETGSTTCNFCDVNFYLDEINMNGLSTNSSSIFFNPEKHCLECPQNAHCPMNTTLHTMTIPEGFWRQSLYTSKLYKCQNLVCSGSTSSMGLERSEYDMYCEPNHEGPLCQVCKEKDQYFSSSKGMCIKRPTMQRTWLILFFIMVVTLCLASAIHRVYHLLTWVESVASKIITMGTKISVQAKMKIFISFYQIISILEGVYGVQLHDDLTRWMNIIHLFSVDFQYFFGFLLQCFASMKMRLLINAVWPYMFIFGCWICLWIYQRSQKYRKSKNQIDSQREIASNVIYLTILVLYLALPCVTKSVFEAIKCQAFDSNDRSVETMSYLVSDLSIQCDDDGNKEYAEIMKMFWVFFFLWPVLVPFLFCALLSAISSTVKSGRVGFLSLACRFLWRDYKKEAMYWDFIDILRKVMLSGLIMFIDTNEGSTKILRLIIGNIISTCYLGLLGFIRPYRNEDDNIFAFGSNIILVCCFTLGIAVQLCSSSVERCQRLIQSSFDFYDTSLMSVVLSFGVIVLSVTYVSVSACRTITAPTLRVVNTGFGKPNLEISVDHRFHAFVSHVWSTGQAKTHTLVRKLQLLLPGILIWLDVDSLTDLLSLERSVFESVVFVIFYSKSYFRSKNCRRELFAAVALGKEIVLLYDGNDEVLLDIHNEIEEVFGKTQSLKNEYETVVCSLLNNPDITSLCNDRLPEASYISTEVMKNTIRWLGSFSQSYALESVKGVCKQILQELPHYKQNPMELSGGLDINRELKRIVIREAIDILVCVDNAGVERVVAAIEDEVRNYCNISIHDADTYLIQTLDTAQSKTGEGKPILLLYLNDQTFLDKDMKVSELVELALDKKIQIVLLHEQDFNNGATPFENFFAVTPQYLLDPPYCIYRDVAIPFFSSNPLYKKVGVQETLVKMGGKKMKSNLIMSVR